MNGHEMLLDAGVVPIEAALDESIRKAVDASIASYVASRGEAALFPVVDHKLHVLTVPEVAARYGLAPTVVVIACEKGWLPARKASGKAWLINEADAQARWGAGKKR